MNFKVTFVLYILILISGLSGCQSLNIDKAIEVNENEDWLMAGCNPEKTNTSKSSADIKPPFDLLWSHDVDAGMSKNSLTVSDAVVFVNTLNGELFALDILSGKSLGRFSVSGESSFSAPLIFGNNIITTSSGNKGNTIFSYNLIRGDVRWARNVRWIESSPVLLEENIYVASVDGSLFKLNVRDGVIIWKSGLKNRLADFYTSPAVSGGKLFLGGTDGIMYAFETKHGKGLWKFNAGAPVYSDVSLKNGRLYFGADNKIFYCVDTAGNKIWEKDLATQFQSSCTFYQNSVITAGVDGKVYSLDTSGGNVNWVFQTKGTISASPVLHKDLIFIGSYDGYFYCINAANGKVLWKYLCEGRVKTTAVIWKEYIFTSSDDKFVYCFK